MIISRRKLIANGIIISAMSAIPFLFSQKIMPYSFNKKQSEEDDIIFMYESCYLDLIGPYKPWLSRALSSFAIEDDLGKFRENILKPHWGKNLNLTAGLSSGAALFCLMQWARDFDRRLVYVEKYPFENSPEKLPPQATILDADNVYSWFFRPRF